MDPNKSLTREQREELLKLLRARREAQKDRKLQDFIPSLIQKAYTLCKAKIRFLVGSNRSGKSEIGAVDVEIRAGIGMPAALKDEYPQDLIRHGEYWVTSLDFPSSRDITQKKIFKFCPVREIKVFNKEFRVLTTETAGSEIGFKSADSGRSKFQGTSKMGIWNDEECPEDVWDEEYMRTTDCEGWMSLTFTPIQGLTWAYSKVYKKASRIIFTRNKHSVTEEVGLVHSLEEIALMKDRELVVMENTSSDADPDIVIFQMSIYDNIHLADIEIQRAEKKYKDDPASYNARVLGRFTKLTGRNVFNVERLLKLQGKCQTNFERGDIENGKFDKNIKGKLVVFKPKKELGRGYYVIGADVAEGLDTGDYSCAQVLDRLTGEQVAVWHGHCSPENFADILVALGTYYNNAFIAPERNFHGFGVVNRIRDHHKYKRLFCWYDEQQKTVKQGYTGDKKYGWETNARTKSILVQNLASFLNDNHLKLNDFNTVDELITYIYQEDGSTGGMRGCFDDRVMALGIAVQLYLKTPIVRYTHPSTNSTSEKVNPYTGYPTA
jgi:phage terminase large subunit-like protein